MPPRSRPIRLAWIALAAITLGGVPPCRANPPGPATPVRAIETLTTVGRSAPTLAALAVAPAEAPTRLPQRVSAAVTEFLQTLGPWAPIALILLLIATNLLCVPGAFLTLASGALFGLWWGFLYVWVGASLGAAAAFLVGRYLAHDRAQRLLRRHPRLAAIEEAVSQEGWKIVFLSRLAPGSPFFLLNYVFSLTRIGFLPYILATVVSMIPGSLLLVYVGSLGQFALAGRQRTAWDWALQGIGLLALLAGVLLITRKARQALARRLPSRRNPANGNPNS